MPKLILHIGTHKTGTTSVQRFLAANREQLRAQGLYYPSTDVGGRFTDQYAHHLIAHAIANTGESLGRTDQDARAFFDAVRESTAEGETVVISAEPMYRHVLRDEEGLSRGRRAYIRAVREAIGDFDVTVYAMVRRQDLFLESLYSEQIMVRPFAEDVDHFLSVRARQADYAARLAEWGAEFGQDRIKVRPYERSEFGESLEGYFLEWLGGSRDDTFELGAPRNVTVPRELV